MTKITLRFELLAPLDKRMMAWISRAGSVYGLTRVQVAPRSNDLIVDFDASRLTVHEVEHEFAKAGIPVRPLP
ncbi:MAG: hypothetical protein KIT83_01240 [Bryobacterales bacterium]|nr:hypothetical protein [Bryobacterales bacterium]